ncbi:hypothetical protein ACWKSP_15105 [Micromonosporaceae bacterium Da 78-11]
MTPQADLIVQIHPVTGDDRRDLLQLTRQLHTALLDLDVDAIDTLTGDAAPAGAKSAGLVESLAVKLGVATLKKAIGKIREWAGRSGRSVKVSIDGDSIELTGATTEQQELLLDIWLARHAPRP